MHVTSSWLDTSECRLMTEIKMKMLDVSSRRPARPYVIRDDMHELMTMKGDPAHVAGY